MAKTAGDREQARSLKVVLSMLTFVPGGMGGGETFARRLGEQLVASTAIEMTALVPESARGFTDTAHESVVEGLTVQAPTMSRVRALFKTKLRARGIRTQMADADVVHFPFTVPAVRPRRTQALVMTVFDTQHKDLPHLFSRLERLFRVFTYDRPARRADAVITISEFSKQSIVRHLKVPAERVHVALLGVDRDAFIPNLDEERESFVFYPARGWAHKNHRALIDAMAVVRQTRPELRLVLTGGALGDIGDLPEWVDNRGLVPHAELLSLYRRATVLAFPSLYEGFGMPPLEAMASGCPVAAARAGSLPEVCGDAAVLFDPYDTSAIAAGILEAIDRREELVPRGLDRVQQFTWEASALVHIEAYRAASVRAAARRD